MNIESLVSSANQIGSFYETMPDRSRAVADIADHIKKFWEPRMRREFLAYLDSPGEHEFVLTPIVDEAIKTHRSML